MGPATSQCTSDLLEGMESGLASDFLGRRLVGGASSWFQRRCCVYTFELVGKITLVDVKVETFGAYPLRK